MTSAKIAIVGAGAVGSTLAYACLVRGVATTVALHDVDAAKVRAEELDLRQGLQFLPTAHVEGSADVSVCAGAQVVAVTAGAKQQPGQTRLDLAASTTRMLRSLMPALVEAAPDARFVMVTNPVDVVTYAAQKLTGLGTEQLFGSGTVLDSARLRGLVAARCGVAVQNVHAYVVGEHGDSEIPLWSSASIGGVPVTDLVAGRRRAATRWPPRWWARPTRSSRARARPTTPSASPAAGSSRRCCATRSGCCRSPRCSTTTTASATSACPCPRWSGRVVPSGGSRSPMGEAELAGLRASADRIRATARDLGF